MPVPQSEEDPLPIHALKCMPQKKHNDTTNPVIPHGDAESPTKPGTTKNEMPAFASMTMEKRMSFLP